MKTLTRLLIQFALLASTQLGMAQPFQLVDSPFSPTYSGPIRWVDLDNDGDLDIIYCGFIGEGGNPTMRVYKNTGGTFSLIGTTLPAIRNGTLAPADFDNDGDLDILVAGYSSSFVKIVELYRNDGGFLFTLHTSLPSETINNAVCWADFDNDRDLDFILTGVNHDLENSLGVTEVWLNAGGTFSKVSNHGLSASLQSSLDCADVNGDGKVDVIMAGINETGMDAVTEYFFNVSTAGSIQFQGGSDLEIRVANGALRLGDIDSDGDPDAVVGGQLWVPDHTNEFLSGVFDNERGVLTKRSNTPLPDTGDNYNGGVKFADFNNDGYLDVVLLGRTGSVVELEFIFRIYMNDGQGSFTTPFELSSGLAASSVDVGDFDNDGDLDICFLGTTPNGIKTGFYKNLAINNVPPGTNTVPSPPLASSFSERLLIDGVVLNWNPGTDAQTPANALAYNYYLRDGATYISVPDVNLTTGYIMAESARGHQRRARVYALEEGKTYHWAVQSVDGAKAGSVFSSEDNFYFIKGPKLTQALFTNFTNVKLDWQDHSSIETSFTVERSTAPLTGYLVTQVLPGNSTTFTDNFAFVPETIYYYRVYDANANGASGYDSIQVVLPISPASLAAGSPVLAESVSIDWEDRSAFETGYIIERKLSAASVYTEIGTLGVNTSIYQDMTTAEGATYNYRVRATGPNGYSDYSNVITVTTNRRPASADLAKAVAEDNVLQFSAADFNAVYSDADADALVNVAITQLSSNGVIKQGTNVLTVGSVVTVAQMGTLTFAPALNFNGSSTFKYDVSDGKNRSLAAYTVSMTVSAVNDAPLAGNLTKTCQEDIPLLFAASDYALAFSDVDTGDALENISVKSLPSNGTLKLSGVNVSLGDIITVAQLPAFSFAPAQDFFGLVSFNFDVSDGEARSAVPAEMKITVTPVNDAPVVAPINSQQAEGNKAIDVAFTVTDVDTPIASVSSTAQSSDVTIVKGEKLTIQGTGANRTLHIVNENKLGEATITITANDGAQTGTTSFKLTIPVVVGLDDQPRPLNVYPNPFVSSLKIQVDSHLAPPFHLTATDAAGRTVMQSITSERESTIDAPGWAPGLYLIQIVGADGASARLKIVKQ